MKKSIALFVLFICVLSCEKDDICPADTPTTPRLFLEFYDNSNQENLKNITGLRVQGIDNEDVLDGYNVQTTNNVLLPLITTANLTQYRFHKNYAVNNNGTPEDPSDDFITGNEDILSITYDTEEVYVSRACGFKTIFTNIDITIESDSDNWILSREATTINQIIIDETTAHFKIFH
jgi:hypothetical protein